MTTLGPLAPMDTAPTDGRKILAVSKSRTHVIVRYMHGDWYGDDEGEAFDDLIAWCALPEIPE